MQSASKQGGRDLNPGLGSKPQGHTGFAKEKARGWEVMGGPDLAGGAAVRVARGGRLSVRRPPRPGESMFGNGSCYHTAYNNAESRVCSTIDGSFWFSSPADVRREEGARGICGEAGARGVGAQAGAWHREQAGTA